MRNSGPLCVRKWHLAASAVVVLWMVETVISPRLSLHQYLDLFMTQKEIRNRDSKDEVAILNLL